MNYAIEILKKEIERINLPSDNDEDDDIYDAVINMRENIELKMAIKVLNTVKNLSDELKEITWK